MEVNKWDKIVHGFLYRWIYVKKMRTNVLHLFGFPNPTPSLCHLTQTKPKHASIHIWARNGPLLRPQREGGGSQTPLQACVT